MREGTADGGASLPARAYVAYALLGLTAVYVLVRNLGGGTDFDAFLPFGIAGLGGLNPYTRGMVEVFGGGAPLWSTWPPSFAPVAALLARVEALLGRPVAVALWQGAGLVALAGVLGVWARWLYGRSLRLAPRSGGLPLYGLAALSGLLVSARLVLSNFEHSQANLIVLGLAVGGLDLLRRGRRWGGGLAVGLSTAFKATPLLLLPYLAWRGRWRAVAASVGGVAVAWLLLPGLLLGRARTVEWYGSWLGFVPSLPLPVVHTNQSLQATVSRLVAPAGSAAGHVEGAGPLGAYGAPVVVVGLAVLLAIAAALAFGRPGRPEGPRREALEAGVVFTLMAVLSPVAWKHHFVGVLPLAMALWSRTPAAPRVGEHEGAAPSADGADVTAPGRRGSGPARSATSRGPFPPGSAATRALYGALAAGALLMNLTATGLVGGGAADRFERFGVITWSSLGLVAVALWVLFRERRTRGAGGRRPGVDRRA